MYGRFLFLIIFFLPALLQAQERSKISGYVVDARKQAVNEAVITLLPDNQVYKTDRTGRFSFENLYVGVYQIAIQRAGFQQQTITVDLQSDTVVNILLEAQSQEIEAVQINGQVTAVDNLIKAENAAMPVKVITRREIELMGSRRLDEVMKEQTGVAVVNDVSGGSRAIGVQMQGFSSNYVMVLVDGQPMLGRNNGNFDLSRISVTNIERIEIIKGASSCLYGSDALGGAINIVTRHGAISPQAQATLLYGSLNIVDATIEAETPFANQRGTFVASGNYYRTDGFNTDGQYLTGGSTTVPPYQNYSFQGRGRYRLSKNGTIGLTARFAARQSQMTNAWSDALTLDDQQQDQDINLGFSYDQQFSARFRSMSRYYFSRNHTEMRAQWLQEGILASAEAFGQQVHRIEQQFAYSAATSLKFTGGLGGSIEQMDNQDLDGERALYTAFGYLQTEWRPVERLLSTLGLRYDYTNVYDGRLSPSLGLQYQITPQLLVKGGVGAGFKAPDYKMRYQVFYNPAANYLVIGADRVAEVIQTMDANGELSYRNTYMVNLVDGNLKAETSLSNNLGFVWNPNTRWQAEVSLFYHRINNQINTVSVGNGTTISQLYSYRNLPKAVNKGFELSLNYQATKDLALSAGYQYLVAKDLAVGDSIRAGNYPYNYYSNPTTGEHRQSQPGDYWGIEDRSRHMLNLKALYTFVPWQMNINLRANIRGKYPFQDTNGNQFIDDADAFVPLHTLINLTVEKQLFNNKLTCRLIADNLLDFTNRNMLGQPGRIMMAGLSYRWLKN
ncbi:TonB-dependent receptor [Sphingobacterium oryzagri]|uniref:TonB-dependent receptor n=1 Tax=Sphingobacterium oryzagri TaxID=3025669 RepID=A0ABY7WMG3_9SPHI|nr:TonB-dependent receptor [Sphingobacterium sp. KACC 22765]WDF70774.1 TonB-dependent receptor [Sphingobacterium sp. KACC 22765]